MEETQVKIEPIMKEIPLLGSEDEPMSIDDHLTLTMLESILSDEAETDEFLNGSIQSLVSESENFLPSLDQAIKTTPPHSIPSTYVMDNTTGIVPQTMTIEDLNPEAAARAEAARKRSVRIKKKAEKKKGDEGTDDMKRKRAKTQMEDEWYCSMPETSKKVTQEATEKKPLTEEEKKQRRLIRNRLSAQLHRERKRAYVDYLEGLVRERDEQIRKYEEEVQNLRARNAVLEAQLGVATVSSDEERSQTDNSLDAGGTPTYHNKKRARTTGSRVATALLAAVSCVALLTSNRMQPITMPSSLEQGDDYSNAMVVPQDTARRKLLAMPPPPPPSTTKTPPPSEHAQSEPVGYERIVERELFSYKNDTFNNRPSSQKDKSQPTDLSINMTRALLRGGKIMRQHNATMAIAPYSRSSPSRRPAATSYVVCSKAAGVFARDSRFPTGPDGPSSNHGALLSLPDPETHDFNLGPGFVQLLVPLPDLDASAWGYSAPQHDDTSTSENDLWLELGAHLAYGRLVHDVKFTL
mmetsp:Transcript_1463/g.1939  ORF Transcript_1463/g.1939 Transcript_1463/m.1939 type:complete len:523 (-) Transcript_1463:295-1863(-)